MAFTSKTVGYAMSDPVDGVFRIIRTEDGGHVGVGRGQRRGVARPRR